MATTLKDVARRAGVSVASASLVLSGKGEGRIAESNAERIREAAEALGYRGNRAARSLRQRSAPLLGMLSLGVATEPYAGAMLGAAQRTARDHDHDLLYIELEAEAPLQDVEENLRLLEEHQVSGVIVASYNHRRLRLPALHTAPLLLLDATTTDLSVDSVVPDEYAAEAKVLGTLVDAGHRVVGWLCEPSGGEAALPRTAAYRDIARDHGWDTSPGLEVYAATSDASDGYAAMARLLDTRPDVTAVACFNDRLAMGAYLACFERGLRIPDDISLVGYDDQTLISEALRPGLTTVSLPHREMGSWAVTRLIERIESAEALAPRQETIIGDLVVRGSVAAPRTNSRRRRTRR
jgi:LacI family transcriptional regulator